MKWESGGERGGTDHRRDSDDEPCISGGGCIFETQLTLMKGNRRKCGVDGTAAFAFCCYLHLHRTLPLGPARLDDCASVVPPPHSSLLLLPSLAPHRSMCRVYVFVAHRPVGRIAIREGVARSARPLGLVANLKVDNLN